MKKEKWILISWFLLTGSTAFAARTINITMPAGSKELLLSNPSSSTVAYSISCYNKLGVATLTATGQSLSADNTASHDTGYTDTGLCASAANPSSSYTDKNGKKVYYCSGANTYSNAGNLCGSGQKFCMPTVQTPACSQYIGQPVWVKSEAGTEKSNDGPCTWLPITLGTDFYYGGSCGNFYYRKVGAGFESLSGLSSSGTGSEALGATCCEDTSSGGICKVTITSTGTNIFLSSPAFKGGAPF